MKKTLLSAAILMIGLLFGTQVMAQGRIDLNASKTSQECRNITMKGFSASFSYSSIESQLMETEQGLFSMITMGNSVAAGNIGDPQVPVTRELIAVPFGATPVVTVKNYTVEEYNLADFGIERLYPQQPSVRKDEKEVKFHYNEAAYMAKGFDEERPIAEVTVMGTMRGIQIGALQLNTLRYNAATNSIRVYNNVEVEVAFENADLALTEKTLVNTYSPYFRTVYASLFNNRAITDIYDEHPDLWSVPVKILVVANRMFEEAMQPWLTWKTEKGFYMDVNYTDEIGTSPSAIKTFITNKYNEGLANGQTPTFLIIVGDHAQVPASQTGAESHCVTDLYYYAVAGGPSDYFGDMFHSRFTCESVTEFNNVLYKSMMYEQYTMPDPSYLSNVLLIAGWDGSWNPRIGKPTIQYATHYYYNAEHGFNNVYEFLQQPYNQPYASLNTGVNFVNYTAHGSNTSWADPSFSNSNVNALTNTDKYFLAMGNCCEAADWGIGGKCLGESFIIAPNKGAYAYIGSCPSSYWYEDYYFGVGATNTMNQMPTYENSTMGVYDATFRDDFNSVSAIPFVGNVAVAYAHANGYQGSVSDRYYWESYHVLGDGSVCPFHTNPIANTVNHLPTLPIGMETYTVEADPGSYVGISKDGVLYGAGEIGEEGVADIPITPITSGGDVKIVVTHPQRQPYIAMVPAAAMTGAYVTVDAFAMNADQANYGETIDLSITLKNVGSLAASNLQATLTTECEFVDILANEGTIASLNPEQTATIEGFQFAVAENTPDNTKALFILNITDGTDTWESKINITLHAPVLVCENIEKEENNLIFTLKNGGSAPFYGGNLKLYSCSNDLVFTENPIVFEDAVEAGASINLNVPYTIAESVEPSTTFEVVYEFTCGLYQVTDVYVLSYGAIMEDFESGNFSDDWTMSPQYPWAIVSGSYDGTSCAKSSNAGAHSSESYMVMTVNVLAAGDLTFMYRVSSEQNWDKFYFYMDNQEKGNWSGSIDWTMFTQPVTVGMHTFKWSYTKDSSVSSGDDCAMVDDIKFPYVNVITFLDPITDLTSEVNDMQVNLSWSAITNATNYIIMRNGEEIANVTEPQFSEVVSYDTYVYTVIATSENGSCSQPATIMVEVMDITSVEESNIAFNVYPNPAKGMLNVNVQANYQYDLFNGMGQLILTGNAFGLKQINVNDLAKGIYVLRITTGNQVNIQKITIE